MENGRRWEFTTFDSATLSGSVRSFMGQSRCKSVGASKGALVGQWKNFTTEKPPTPSLLSQFVEGCAAKGVRIEAKIVGKAIEISKATYTDGAARSESEWHVVARVAPVIFGKCTTLGPPNYEQSKVNPDYSTRELKRAGASNAVQPKGVGAHKCSGCGLPGGNWRTCPRNDKVKKGSKRHEDGGGIEGAKNGRKQRKGKHDGKHVFAPYLAGQKAPPKTQAKKAVSDDDDFEMEVVPRAASSRPGRAAAAKTSQKAKAVFDEDEDNDSEFDDWRRVLQNHHGGSR